MKRKKKKYNKPRKKFEKQRIEEENLLIKRYGLKNKKEIWKADAEINKIRNKAKKLITGTEEEKQKLIQKLIATGFKVEKIADILGLNKEDILKRRLQTILVEKKLARTPKQARQLITHKKVMINGKKINSPSYIVSLNEEGKIELISAKLKKRKSEEEKIKEKKGETSNDKNIKSDKRGIVDTKIKKNNKEEDNKQNNRDK